MSRKFLEEAGITVAGGISSLLTALLVLLVERLTGFNVFTFSIWLIVPAGALFTGFAAASGYYFSSIVFHHRANKSILLNMVLIAGCTQVLIYYLQYVTLVLDDGRQVSGLIGFADYLKISLTTAKYSFYQHGRSVGGGVEVGGFGYALGGLQFIGFLVGGFTIWVVLAAKAYCSDCKKYFSTLAKKVKQFPTIDTFKSYAGRFEGLGLFSPEHLAIIEEPGEKKVKIEKGSASVSYRLYECPGCRHQLFEEKVQVFNGQDWKDVGTEERTLVPVGISLKPTFNVLK